MANMKNESLDHRVSMISMSTDNNGRMLGKQEDCGRAETNLLIFIFHVLIEFSTADLAKHLCINLSRMAICRLFIVLLFMLLPFRLN